MTDMTDMTDPHNGTGPPGHATAGTYLFVLTDGGGTVPPELGVARRLVDRGHTVTALADESLADQVLHSGAGFLPLTWKTAAVRDWESRNPMKVARATADAMMTLPAPAQASDTVAAIAAIGPDLVLTSAFAVGAMIAAETSKIPFDVLIPNAYPFPAAGIPPFGAGLAPAHGRLGRARDRLVSGAGTRLFDRYALAAINEVRARHGLGPVSHTWGQMQHARRQLILTSASFDFPGTLPTNARYLGPILDDPSWAIDDTWAAPAGAGPLVLVAMSSTFQNHAGCLQRIADALGDMPVRGLVTTGPTIRPEEIDAPDNVTVTESAPHREVLRHASLVVTHGGHGSVIKALAAGLPLVILPHGRDQADNAVRVTSREAGISVPRGASSARIGRAITEVLNTPVYRRAAVRLGQAIRRDASSTALLDELEGVASA